MENNIDKLFQEKLKNLETIPNERVWNAIEQKLTKKKKRVFPFWWISSGIAALFLLGLFLFPTPKKDNPIYKNNVIITNDSKKEINNTTSDSLKIDSKLILEKKLNEILIVDEKSSKEKNIIEKKTTKNKTIFVAEKITNDSLIKRKSNIPEIFIADIDRENLGNKNIVNTKPKKDSVFVKQEKLQELKSKKDFMVVVEKEKNIEKNSAKKSTNNWSVSPVVAILNSNSFTSSSPIDVNLSNSTTGKNSFSYGVQISYKINKKWSVQSGIHQQNTRYENSNISVSQVASSATSSVVLNSNNTFSFIDNKSLESLSLSDATLVNNVSSNGNLFQEYGYVEIPLEIKYNLSNSTKFDSEIVVGFSSLFLNKNNFELQTNNSNQSGFVNNLNSLNFSGNFGVDFSYYLNKKWSININPMLKAQLNTFNNKANGFSPFNIGVYSGFKYNF